MMSKRKVDINGYIEIKDNPISKIGVFQYSGNAIGGDADPMIIYNVYRPEEELSNEETINSFKLAPWINDHPDGKLLGDGSGYEAPENKGVDGVIGESVYYKDGVLYANIKAFANSLKKYIKNGKIELSAGFRCVYEKASGTFNGQVYDYIQRSIRGNHLALVDQGRMGPDIAVLDRFNFTFDAKELEMADENIEVKAEDQEPTMAEVVAMVKAITEKVDKLVGMEEAEAAGEDKDMPIMADSEEPKEAEDKEYNGMDAIEKRITALEAENKALKSNAVKSVIGEVSQRDALVKKLVPHIGAFDHAEKTLNEVAEYGVKKLGINVPKGHEVTAINAYFAASKVNGSSVALDSAPKKNTSVIDNYLSQSA